MSNWLFLLPLVSALLGWIIHSIGLRLFIKKILPARQAMIAEQVGKLASREIMSFSQIEEKINNGEALQKLMPIIETHIDDFLRHKLGKAMPVISMFIGDKTINQLKSIFMKELEEIFPATIKTYFQHLQKDIDVEKIVREKIAGIPPETMEMGIKQSMGEQLRLFLLFGALSGFIIGLAQLFLIWLVVA